MNRKRIYTQLKDELSRVDSTVFHFYARLPTDRKRIRSIMRRLRVCPHCRGTGIGITWIHLDGKDSWSDCNHCKEGRLF